MTNETNARKTLNVQTLNALQIMCHECERDVTCDVHIMIDFTNAPDERAYYDVDNIIMTCACEIDVDANARHYVDHHLQMIHDALSRVDFDTYF